MNDTFTAVRKPGTVWGAYGIVSFCVRLEAGEWPKTAPQSRRVVRQVLPQQHQGGRREAFAMRRCDPTQICIPCMILAMTLRNSPSPSGVCDFDTCRLEADSRSGRPRTAEEKWRLFPLFLKARGLVKQARTVIP